MPLTSKGEKILSNMKQEYGTEREGNPCFTLVRNAGTISGVDKSALSGVDAILRSCHANSK